MSGPLGALVQHSAELREAVRLYDAMSAALRTVDVRVEPEVFLSSNEALAKLRSGVPLLHGIDRAVDVGLFSDIMISLLQAIEAVSAGGCIFESSDNVSRTAAARQVREALQDRLLDPEGVLQCAAAGEQGLIVPVARSLRLDPAMLWTVAQNALKHFLRAWCRQLPPLAAGPEWQRGACYVCGATATLSELQGGNAEKHLRCGQCGADWQHRRLECMYCGNEDHRTLGYLQRDDWGSAMRVEVCENCRGYLKVITTFAPTPTELLMLQDLATLALDYAAQGQGYVRGKARL